MKASESKLLPLIEGTKQYVVPLFQRPYSWTKDHWKILWDDLSELCEESSDRTHFLGSIVTAPTVSVPEGVTKYLLIDGQQRLTTVFVLLCVIRDLAAEHQSRLAEEIKNTLLLNSYKDNQERFKLLPTHLDRSEFLSMIDGKKLSGRWRSTIGLVLKSVDGFEWLP